MRPSSQRARATKVEAARLKFDQCGIAAANLPIDSEDRLGEWLRRGYHADMAWMERTRAVRQSVGEKLAGAKSVVVVARNYYATRPEGMPGTGRVSRYAWGRDYHRVLEKALRRLARFVDAFEDGAESYCCIDTGPVMEKAWAVRAGIGWLGKNSLVLNREMGSWFFLGVILTNVELAPDEVMTDQCGGCTLCIDACPTQAIVQERVVDSSRCISYQTIENRGEIPPEIANRSGDWLFGCDVCQEVCPWTRRVRATTEPDFEPRRGHANPNLDELIDLDEEGFALEYAGTPIMRAKLSGMRRNAAVVRKNLESTGVGETD